MSATFIKLQRPPIGARKSSTIPRGAHDVAANIATGRSSIVRKESGSNLGRPQVFNVRHPQATECRQKSFCFKVALERLSNARNTFGKSIVIHVGRSLRRLGPRIRVVECHLTAGRQVRNVPERGQNGRLRQVRDDAKPAKESALTWVETRALKAGSERLTLKV